ncbi:RRP15-like protein [Hydractinia symbiolongicarpus]|uniref:RRP15-like protein n=1 Tax=Hydractinia symbiolongicarpus TaxID=13093 RepID=UPI0025502783|nr:RRP15-like protein [Hydractinia symbiolongicarpus]
MAAEQRAQDPNEDDGGIDADIESDDGDNNVKNHGMVAMGDIISKILAKPLPESVPAILSKSKKSQKRKLEMREELLIKKDKAEERLEKREKNHVLPTRSNAQKEVLLKRIATKGVVKLFNAVSAHQKLVSEKMKEAKTEARKSKAVETVTKSSFMDLLKTNKDKKKSEEENSKENDKQNKKWDVLRDDFMLGASMKDWDKTNENEVQEEKEASDSEDTSE